MKIAGPCSAGGQKLGCIKLTYDLVRYHIVMMAMHLKGVCVTDLDLMANQILRLICK